MVLEIIEILQSKKCLYYVSLQMQLIYKMRATGAKNVFSNLFYKMKLHQMRAAGAKNALSNTFCKMKLYQMRAAGVKNVFSNLFCKMKYSHQ